MQLEIPSLIASYNEIRFSPVINASMFIETLPPEKRPQACISCGACKAVCPQKIDIPAALKEFSDRLNAIPSWAETCAKRDEEQRRMEKIARGGAE